MGIIQVQLPRLCLFVAVILFARCQPPGANPDQTPALEPEERFRDISPLHGEGLAEQGSLDCDFP